MNFFLWTFKLRLKARRLERQNRQLKALLLSDDVTTAKSRRGLNAAVEKLEDDAKKRGTVDRHTLLLIDVNRFKAINDTYGHDAGDQVLRDVVHKLEGSTRAEDAIARIGGDEFVVLLAHCPPEKALERAKQVHDLLASSCIANGCIVDDKIVDNVEIFYTCSVGCAPFKTGEDWHHARRRADKSMYQAKQAERAARLSVVK